MIVGGFIGIICICLFIYFDLWDKIVRSKNSKENDKDTGSSSNKTQSVYANLIVSYDSGMTTIHIYILPLSGYWNPQEKKALKIQEIANQININDKFKNKIINKLQKLLTNISTHKLQIPITIDLNQGKEALVKKVKNILKNTFNITL